MRARVRVRACVCEFTYMHIIYVSTVPLLHMYILGGESAEVARRLDDALSYPPQLRGKENEEENIIGKPNS